MATQISQKQATDTVEKMYSDGELFMQRWNALINLQAYVKGTPLEKDYADLMSRGGKIRQTIDSVHFQVKKAYESIGQKVTDAWQWMKSKAGLEGMDGVEDVGMGVLPLLPIVAIGLTASAGAASAAMLNWSREADKFIGVYNDMVKRGVDPRVAAQMLNQNVTGPAPKGWLERLGLPSTESIGKLVLIGGGIYLFGKWRKWW